MLSGCFGRLVATARRLGVTNEELVSLCGLGVCVAANRYSDDGSAKFDTFAVAWMRGEVSAEVRRRVAAMKRPKHLSVSHEWPEGKRAADMIFAPDTWAEYEAQSDLKAVVSEAERVLPHSVREAVYSQFRGETEASVCKRLRVSLGQLVTMRRVGLNALRRAVGVAGASGARTGRRSG